MSRVGSLGISSNATLRIIAAFRAFLAGVLHRADYHLNLVEEQRARIGGSMHGGLTCAQRARCLGVRTLMPPRALAVLAKFWWKLMKASQPSALARCGPSAKSTPCRIQPSAFAAAVASSRLARGSPAKSERALAHWAA